MRQVLRDMRYLAFDLWRRGVEIEADKLHEMVVQLPTVKQSEQIRMWRGELLEWSLQPNLQDALAVIVSQLRMLERNLRA